jgi:hypothetical protein
MVNWRRNIKDSGLRRKCEGERVRTRRAIRSPEPNWRFLKRPSGMRALHLASKTMHLKGCFQRLGRLRAIESSGFMERAMGIEIIATLSRTYEVGLALIWKDLVFRPLPRCGPFGPRGVVPGLRPNRGFANGVRRFLSDPARSRRTGQQKPAWHLQNAPRTFVRWFWPWLHPTRSNRSVHRSYNSKNVATQE